ncbi:MAG: ferredoxin domain-containing protein [Desulfotomaculales bacterium]
MVFAAVELVAELMALAARTAPKALGHDCLEVKVVTGEALQKLAAEMDRYGRETGKANFDRDADNVRRSSAVLLVALKENRTLGLNCGACGNEQCSALKTREGGEFPGPFCAWRLVDLGIALGSAARTASLLCADSRIMYRVGVVARKAGFVEGLVALGIPVSAHSKNIYFDRLEQKAPGA